MGWMTTILFFDKKVYFSLDLFFNKYIILIYLYLFIVKDVIYHCTIFRKYNDTNTVCASYVAYFVRSESRMKKGKLAQLAYYLKSDFFYFFVYNTFERNFRVFHWSRNFTMDLSDSYWMIWTSVAFSLCTKSNFAKA